MFTLAYLLVGWYVTVDAVFVIDSVHLWMVQAWLLVLVIDIVLNLNTVKLVNGRSLRTRWNIFCSYLRSESYLDLVMGVDIVAHHLDPSVSADLILHTIAFVVLLKKLGIKGELLRTHFPFKKYIVMIDSVLLLLTASHFSVRPGLFRHSFCTSVRNSSLNGAGWRASVSQSRGGVSSTCIHFTGLSQP